MAKIIGEVVSNLETHLDMLKFVKSHFPDAKMTLPYMTTIYDKIWKPNFNSKSVNLVYEKFIFQTQYQTLYVIPYVELTYNDEIIKVHSAPQKSRLAYINYVRTGLKRTIRFSRLAINMKNNNFKDDLLNEARVEIVNFIKANPDCNLDTKHLEPRLKKLLAFA